MTTEELFKPITKRLDKTLAEPGPGPEEEPNYEMDEFDRINPFDWEEGYRPEAATPPPSEDDDDDFEFPPPPSPLEEVEALPPRLHARLGENQRQPSFSKTTTNRTICGRSAA